MFNVPLRRVSSMPSASIFRRACAVLRRRRDVYIAALLLRNTVKRQMGNTGGSCEILPPLFRGLERRRGIFLSVRNADAFRCVFVYANAPPLFLSSPEMKSATRFPGARDAARFVFGERDTENGGGYARNLFQGISHVARALRRESMTGAIRAQVSRDRATYVNRDLLRARASEKSRFVEKKTEEYPGD